MLQDHASSDKKRFQLLRYYYVLVVHPQCTFSSFVIPQVDSAANVLAIVELKGTKSPLRCWSRPYPYPRTIFSLPSFKTIT